MGVCPQVTICLTIFAVLSSLQFSSVLTTLETDLEHNADDALEVGEDEFVNRYGFPGEEFEFRFEIGAGKVQCFYQALRKDAQLHVTFEVRN